MYNCYGDIMENKFSALSELNKAIENELDFDFSVNEKRILTTEDFNKYLKNPFGDKNKMIFYRGERKNDLSRPLVPTLLRNKKNLLQEGTLVLNIDSEYLRNFYKGMGQYLNVFETMFSDVSQYRMYELCSFSQHYLGISPFIDFTKSLYVALSFATKGRREVENDIVVYTAEISDFDNYTNDIVVAECWLNNYKVSIYNSPDEIFKLKNISMTPSAFKKAKASLESRIQDSSPKAKMIDIPTNDLVKYQQGVFLLLTDFAMYHKSYLTKNLREDFLLTKYIISKDICSELVDMISEEAPWYEYDCLLNIKTAMGRAVTAQKIFCLE